MVTAPEFIFFVVVYLICVFIYILQVRKLDEEFKRELEPIKKARPEDEYLVVCKTKKRAMYWRNELMRHISGCYKRDEIKVINNYGKYICIYFPQTHLIVRFISERDYHEASAGFRGWVVEEYQVEEWIAAAEAAE